MTARPAHPALTDALVAVSAFALTLGVTAGGHDATRQLDALGVVLAAAASLPLVARRRAPLGVFVVCSAASAVLSGLGYGFGLPVGPTIALYFVALDERTRAHIVRTVGIVVAVFVVHIAASQIPHSGFPTTAVLSGVVLWGGTWMAGDQIRLRRRRRLESEREMARERRLAAAEERTRIARDLHDSAAHAINVILVQAGAARLLQQRDPGAAQTALTTIEDVARETIGEIDHLVHGLREDDGSTTVDPPTGLAALDTLVGRYRASDLPVELRIDGEARPLAPRLDQAAYRILQESLTNAARHGTGTARVRVHYGGSRLELTVLNPVAPGANGHPAGGGHGILGMRERASLLGGTLTTERAGDRFTVEAQLPYGLVDETR